MSYEDAQPRKGFIPSPDLAGKDLSVSPGEYALLQGTNSPVAIREDQIYIINDGHQMYPDPYAGVHSRGLYKGGEKQIVSFLYHKLDSDGQLETTERVIVWTGIGYGEHSDHMGQAPSWYLIGAQIGTIDPESGALIDLPETDVDIPVKHFSIACITDGPLGEPVLANSAQ